MTATIAPTSPGSRQTEPAFLLSVDIAAGRIAIHGDFDRQRVQRFLDAVRLLAYSPSPSWSIDVSAVTFCDAGGLRALLAAQRCAEQRGKDFRVTRAGPWMRHLLPIIGVTAFEATQVLRAVE
jgi:anti-anti-sigma regulatory factor